MFAPIFQRGPSREKTFRRNATSLFRWLLPRCSFLRVSCAGGILALGFRHPLRRPSSPLALALCKALHDQDGLLDPLPLRAKFRNHLDDVHTRSPVSHGDSRGDEVRLPKRMDVSPTLTFKSINSDLFPPEMSGVRRFF